MRYKYLIGSAFIAGLSFSSFVDAKAEENICYYSNPIEYKSCFNKKSSLERKPRYPLKTQDYYSWNHRDIMWIGCNPCGYGPHSSPGSIYTIFEPVVLNNKESKLIIGDKKTGLSGINLRDKFISKKKDFIKKEDFVSWEGKESINEYSNGYLISYIDEFGNMKNLKFIRFKVLFSKTSRREEFMIDFLNNLTGLQIGETRSIDSILNNKLKTAIKNHEIIGSIIKLPSSSDKQCIEVDKDKYPDLTKKYIRLSKTINPLRAKLDLEETRTIRPICSL